MTTRSSARAPLCEEDGNRKRRVRLSHAGVLQGRMGRNLRIRQTARSWAPLQRVRNRLVAPQNSTRAAVTRSVARNRTAERSVAVRLSRPFERSSSRRARVARPHGRLPFRTHRGKISHRVRGHRGARLRAARSEPIRKRSSAPPRSSTSLLAPSRLLASRDRRPETFSWPPRPSGFPAITLQTKNPLTPTLGLFPSMRAGRRDGQHVEGYR